MKTRMMTGSCVKTYTDPQPAGVVVSAKPGTPMTANAVAAWFKV
jgi:hypothetical protein